MSKSKYILPIIIISQFCCTSLWFASNGVMTDLITSFNLDEIALSYLTSSVQFGFIIGTLLFALFTIADRFSPSKVFFVCAVLGAFFNLRLVFENQTFLTLIGMRFLTGFFLAGIYPVGMKIATDYYNKGLGKSLGYLVGALVLGTALPHLLKDLMQGYSWKTIIISISTLAAFGGLLMLLFVPNGPYRTAGKKLDITICFSIFKNTKFRKAAFGYFGHMWELYTFWTFVPILLKIYENLHSDVSFNIPLLSFFIIAIGSLSCVVAGYLSEKFGTKNIAYLALLFSCICCLISPLIFQLSNENLFIAFLLFWGMVVVADSPLFSTLVAQNVASENKGTALTIVNCIGFTITIVSIQLISSYTETTDSNLIYLLLAIGPILGLLTYSRKKVIS
ncbi:MFS transporter [Polaribacter sp. R2A056_3_33]|uniref:MFS transporter n=1 Tax=unclassified Polaribacter TaxID=196858 RepID=UPI001C4EC9F8|nr:MULTISPECIES: MFS transporter [unclassified Polaribacter]QXP62336.1 MFS transporter [Polaribacter sp. HaHaR_3_91]QXP70262.1 MFS transporter [Polaribacter sp. R2A056_3_33]